jgi:hypothetical protein
MKRQRLQPWRVSSGAAATRVAHWRRMTHHLSIIRNGLVMV